MLRFAVLCTLQKAKHRRDGANATRLVCACLDRVNHRQVPSLHHTADLIHGIVAALDLAIGLPPPWVRKVHGGQVDHCIAVWLIRKDARLPWMLRNASGRADRSPSSSLDVRIAAVPGPRF